MSDQMAADTATTGGPIGEICSSSSTTATASLPVLKAWEKTNRCLLGFFKNDKVNNGFVLSKQIQIEDVNNKTKKEKKKKKKVDVESCYSATWTLRQQTRESMKMKTSTTDSLCSRETRRRKATMVAAEEEERARFSVSLTTEEIAEDIYAVTGTLPRRRPKRRTRIVQKQLDVLFPGMWLAEITADLYKVPD